MKVMAVCAAGTCACVGTVAALARDCTLYVCVPCGGEGGEAGVQEVVMVLASSPRHCCC